MKKNIISLKVINITMKPDSNSLIFRAFSLPLILVLLSLIFFAPLALTHNNGKSGKGYTPSQTDEDVVKKFYPQSLINESAEDFSRGGSRPFQAYGFAVGAYNGSDYIFAAYTNGVSGAIRVLHKQENAASLVYEPNLPYLAGVFAGVRLIDLDHDRRPEVIVSLSSAKGNTSDWVFKWDGAMLQLIGPSVTDENGYTATILTNASFTDLDGDGILEIVNSPSNKDINTFGIYKLTGDSYTLFKTAIFFDKFIKREGAPTMERVGFSVDRADIPYLLKIINGESDRRNIVSSVVIRLNGAVVVAPKSSNRQASQITTPVTLQSSNTLEVELEGATDSQITLIIESRQ